MDYWRYRILHFLGSTSFFFWIAIRATYAQTHEVAFGEERNFPLPEKYEKSKYISVADQGETKYAVWTPHQKEIMIASFDSTLSSFHDELKPVEIDFDDLYTADFNNDGLPDAILTNRQNQTVSILLSLLSDSLSILKTIPLPIEPANILLGDYNNDGNADILIYAQNSPGLVTLKGNGKGGFAFGKIIAQENAIGAADFAQVNNDQLIDLLVWDWVKREIHIYYGVGNGRFIDQSVFPAEGEVEELHTAPASRIHGLELVLKTSNPSGFQFWEGNEYGDFQIKNSIAIQGQINSYCVGDINNDGFNDILTAVNPAALEVFINNDGESFSERMEYAAGSFPQDVTLVSPHREEPKDCILYDKRGGQFIVYRNATRQSSMLDSLQLATGVSPTEIIASDFNCDGISDVALINDIYPSLSLYFGQKTYNPIGPYMYSLTEKPSHVSYYSTTKSSWQFVLSYSSSNQISFFTIDTTNSSVTNAFIGCEGDSRVIETKLTNSNPAKFITLNTITSEGRSLSFYDQLGPSTFIERTFRLSSPNELLSATVGDVNNDSLLDIIYAYRNADSAQVALGVSFGDSIYSMKRRIVSRELELQDVKQIMLWLSDFNNDGFCDILFYAGSPSNCLMVARGRGDGYFDDPQIAAKALQLFEPSDIQLVDLDRDGFTDIVVGTSHGGRVSWLKNNNDCMFAPERILYIEPQLRSYVIADIDADGKFDLAMTLSKQGVLKIINGKQLDLQSK